MSLQVALNQTNERIREAVKAMREFGLAETTAIEKNEASGEHREKFEKALKGYEELKRTAQNLEAAIKAEAEQATVVNAPGATRAGSKQEKKRTKAEIHKEAFRAYLRGGDVAVLPYEAEMETLEGVGPEEAHALLGTQANLGGFLVPEDFRTEVVKNLSGYAVVRPIARVVQTNSSMLVFPSIAGGTDPFSTGFAGTWRSEGAQGTDGSAPATQDQPTFGQEKVPVHTWQPGAVVITQELLQDSAVNLDSVIAQVIAETKAHDEDAAFLIGDGVGRPRGVLDYVGGSPAIATVVTGDANLLTYNGLVDLMMNLPAQYRQNSTWAMRSTTFGAVLKLKDSSQMPILYANAIPDTLFGKRVVLSEQLPAVAASAEPIIFGDFRFYCIAERQELRVQRLLERFAPNVGVLATARLGGGVLRTEAFRVQTVSA